MIDFRDADTVFRPPLILMPDYAIFMPDYFRFISSSSFRLLLRHYFHFDILFIFLRLPITPY